MLIAAFSLLGLMGGSAAAKTTVVAETKGLIQVNRSITLGIEHLGPDGMGVPQARYYGTITNSLPAITTLPTQTVVVKKKTKRRRQRGKESGAEAAAQKKKKTKTLTGRPSSSELASLNQAVVDLCRNLSTGEVTVRHNSNPPFVIGRQSQPSGNLLAGFDYSVVGPAAPMGDPIEAFQTAPGFSVQELFIELKGGFDWRLACTPNAPANLSVTVSMP